MRNNLSLFIIIIFGGLLCAQEKPKGPTTDYTARQVETMAVFPGCESTASKVELQKCLQQNLNLLLADYLADFSDKMNEMGIDLAVAKVQFVIDKNGKIIQIKSMGGGTPELGEAAEIAMLKIANAIPRIEPATLTGGEKVNLIFQMPIRYSLESSAPKNTVNIDYSEVVVSTLKGEDETYEVRMNKDLNRVRVYEISTGKDIFLGNFQSPAELLDIEPYKSLILALGDRIMLTEATFDGVLYRFYTQANHDGMIYIYKFENGKEVLETTMNESEFMNVDAFVELIFKP
jgi:hypothetical protein